MPGGPQRRARASSAQPTELGSQPGFLEKQKCHRPLTAFMRAVVPTQGQFPWGHMVMPEPMLVAMTGGGHLVGGGQGFSHSAEDSPPHPTKNDLAPRAKNQSRAGLRGNPARQCPSPCSDGQCSQRGDHRGTWIYVEQTVCV